MPATSSWRYNGSATSERLAALLHSPLREQLPAALCRGLILACYHRDPGQTDSSYERAIFCGSVDPTLFDWFFNARTGYRGAYYDSPEAGLRFNRILIDHLAPMLVSWAASQDGRKDIDWVRRSLSAPSAKAWLSEHPGVCQECAGEWSQSHSSDLQIENERWESETHTHAAWGRQAPLLSKIRIFGGLINAQNQEWVAGHKKNRATHISEHGWS
jgi:hypothetical protein